MLGSSTKIRSPHPRAISWAPGHVGSLPRSGKCKRATGRGVARKGEGVQVAAGCHLSGPVRVMAAPSLAGKPFWPFSGTWKPLSKPSLTDISIWNSPGIAKAGRRHRRYGPGRTHCGVLGMNGGALVKNYQVNGPDGGVVR
jgi:hypothetical protein